MNAEQRWAQNCEWEAEGEGIEISKERPFVGGICEELGCDQNASFAVEIKRVQDSSGRWFQVCKAHNDNEILYELYEKRVMA